MMNPMKDRRGQFLIETVLMMIVTIGLFTWGMGQLREGKFLAKLISGPWEKVAVMIETGVWETRTVGATKHPNTFNRGISLDPSQ
ncbi:hypothetical protein [Bdellovibrio sp. HCB2-146]|uniref:hypothetical protein n=1 Tax=Bdellovibrio sp. HCB2-146 TaxID=3394362 RepID=UPI0039BD932B